jgi:hypothetical protein
MTQDIACGLIVSPKNIGKKDVFPRASAHGPRFDLAQAYVAQRKYAKSLEQYSRTFFRANPSESCWRLCRSSSTL